MTKHADELDLALGRAVRAAAVCLPAGWQITLTVEREGYEMTLLDPDGEPVEFASNRETLDEEMRDALAQALEQATEVEPP